ncbi:hypothetical protein CSAL01_12878 [Colletotrichum salicis]|uniref:Uncharacterized protein n=1 Tax=Colletotrichum salicis TaxID=1209931 RepID=A0A135V1V8_9PEZI|nr:hypothetical protein CSAL01_12878 [Colletotrichum salicis]
MLDPVPFRRTNPLRLGGDAKFRREDGNPTLPETLYTPVLRRNSNAAIAVRRAIWSDVAVQGRARPGLQAVEFSVGSFGGSSSGFFGRSNRGSALSLVKVEPAQQLRPYPPRRSKLHIEMPVKVTYDAMRAIGATRRRGRACVVSKTISC